jgi:predicted cobalt transporter CbtA
MNEMPPAPSPHLPPWRYSAGQIFMIVIGIIFLLPGLCALGFVIGMAPDLIKAPSFDSISQMIFAIWLICFAISAVGIALIVVARKRARRQP